ncbi:MAG: PH domain-containing protein [Euzebya sp.]
MSEEPQRFDIADLDATARAVTLFTIGLLFIIPAAIGLTSRSVPRALAIAAMSAAILAGAYAFSPAGYVLAGATLRIRKKLWRSFTCTVEGFSDHPDPQRLGLRVAGSSGGFGWYGRFRRRDIGMYRAHLSSRDSDVVVALQTSAGIVVVSPENRKAFVAAIRKALR